MAKGYICQVDLKAHEMNIHHKISLKYFLIKEETGFCCQMCGKRFHLRTGLLKAHERNIHHKVSLESIFESKSEQDSVARCVAIGSIWQVDLKAHEKKYSPQSQFEVFLNQRGNRFLCQMCGKRFHLTTGLESA